MNKWPKADYDLAYLAELKVKFFLVVYSIICACQSAPWILHCLFTKTTTILGTREPIRHFCRYQIFTEVYTIPVNVTQLLKKIIICKILIVIILQYSTLYLSDVTDLLVFKKTSLSKKLLKILEASEKGSSSRLSWYLNINPIISIWHYCQ